MRRGIATSRCEVGGKVYLPGDDMTVTDEQFVELTQYGAINEIKLQAASPSFGPGATIAEYQAYHEQRGGKAQGSGKPKKEK